ncbi:MULTISPECIES: hypothetical protein [unclassified Mucilaginibacter]|uniref:hypothetical protein n=1 Tax=unclassified Mucilaginibacter TaxID=2617802 RepID=UPI00138BBAA6|nr:MULTISPECIES: hypothetical protein [unclassified Mucilaginibacter]MBB5394460.1 hypothetical protein [Mucilaginibacter sp. AK015]QHS57136.1 hypothetical protein GWR56_16915 [Mucilaginibacter sp. 14171R-50]
MKKQFLSFALVATMIGSIAAGCSSEKKTGGSDSTMTDSTATMATPAPDSAKMDTMRKDTTTKDTTTKPM